MWILKYFLNKIIATSLNETRAFGGNVPLNLTLNSTYFFNYYTDVILASVEFKFDAILKGFELYATRSTNIYIEVFFQFLLFEINQFIINSKCKI